MTFLKLTFYELKSRLRLTMSMFVLALLSIVIVLEVVPLISKSIEQGMHNTKFSVAFVDEDQSPYVLMAMEQFMKAPSVEAGFSIIQTNEIDAKEMLEQNEIAAIVTIPSGFVKSMQSGDLKKIQVLLNPQQGLYAHLVENGMESGAYIMSAVQNALYTVYSYTSELPLSEEEVQRIFNFDMISMISYAMNRDGFFIRSFKTPWEDMDSIDFYSISVLLLFMSLYSAGIIFQWHEGKEKGLISRMEFACKRPGDVICSNLLANSILIFIQGILIFVPLFVIRHDITTLKMLPFLFLIALNISAIVMIFAEFIKNSTSAIVAFVIFTVLSALASGNIIPFIFLPDFIPGGMRKWTLNYYWQQMMIQAQAKGFLGQWTYTLIVIGVTTVIIVVLRSVAGEKNRNYKIGNQK